MSDRVRVRGTPYLLYLIAGAGLIAASMLSAVFLNVSTGVITAAYYVLCLALPVLLASRGRAAKCLRAQPLPPSRLLPIALLTGLCLMVVNGVTLLWELPFELAGLNTNLGSSIDPQNSRELVACVLMNAALPAVCEELLFRGYMLSELEVCGTRRAVLATSVLFALLHASPVGFPAEFLLGLLLGVLCVYTNSIYAPIIYHTLHNAAVIVISYLQRGEETVSVWASIGGAAGIVSVLLDILLFAVPAYFLLRMLVRRGKDEGIACVPHARGKMTIWGRLAQIIGIFLAFVLMAITFVCMLPQVGQ